MTFTDNFNRDNENVEASADWTKLSGDAGAAKVVTNKVDFTDASPEPAYICPDQGSANHYTQIVRPEGSAGNYFECCIRLTDFNNWIGMRRGTSSKWQLFKRESGGFTVLGDSVTPAPTAGDVVYLEGDGDSITLKVNSSTIVGPITESFNNTETRQGFVNRVVRLNALDDFEAAALGVAIPAISLVMAPYTPAQTVGQSDATVVYDRVEG